MMYQMCFHRSSRFYRISSHAIELSQLAGQNYGGCSEMIDRVMTKDNVGLALVLETMLPVRWPSALHPNDVWTRGKERDNDMTV